MRFVPRPPARETIPPPGRAFFPSAVEDYAVLSARVRREIESALREHRETLLADLHAVEKKEET